MTKPKLKLWPRPIEGSQPVPAFADSEGVTYYHFPNDLESRAGRVMSYRDAYQELDYNIDRKDLMAGFAGMEAALNKGQLVEASRLLHELRSRVGFLTNIDLLYKLASVLYFDDTENPHSVDQDYCFKKIQRWKADKKLPAFFLKQPFIGFLPFLDPSKHDIPDSLRLKAFNDMEQNQPKDRATLLRLVLSALSGTANNSEESTYLSTALETLKKPITLKESL